MSCWGKKEIENMHILSSPPPLFQPKTQHKICVKYRNTQRRLSCLSSSAYLVVKWLLGRYNRPRRSGFLWFNCSCLLPLAWISRGSWRHRHLFLYPFSRRKFHKYFADFIRNMEKSLSLPSALIVFRLLMVNIYALRWFSPITNLSTTKSLR